MEIVQLNVNAVDDGTRLDQWISSAAGLSRARAQKLVREGRVLVDGSARKPSFVVETGMSVRLEVPEPEPDLSAAPAAEPLKLAVLYEDAHIVVVDKAAGMTVHPGAGILSGTLVNALLDRYPEIVHVGDPQRPGIVHRLDKLTSGVMVVARSAEAYDRLVIDFKEHRHLREYKALCHGHMKESEGRIETLLGRHAKDRKKMSTRVSEGREAITNWTVEREWPGFSLLSLQLETGRTHQIRVHMSEAGHPVLGDPVYGGRKRANSIPDQVVRNAVRGLERQMLHAARLGLTHPVTGVNLEFVSELPGDMRALMQVLDERLVP